MTKKRPVKTPAAKRTPKPTSKPASKPSPAASPALNKHGILTNADPRNVARAIELTESIARRKARISEDFYQMGQELKELRDRKLFQKVYGFDSFTDFLTKRAVYSATQAYKLIAIVEGMSKRLALKVGVEKAYESVLLAKTTPEKDSADTIFRGGRKVQGKRPSEATPKDFAKERETVRAKVKKEHRSEAVVTEAKKARLAARKAGLVVLRALLGSAGIATSTVHEREDEVAVLLPWATVEKLKAGTKKKKAK